MKKMLSFLLCFSFGACWCQPPKTIRLSPEDAKGGNVSDIFQTIEYVPLETTKESLFGRINQLIVFDDKFFILDEQTNSILIFESSGRFRGKVYGGNAALNFNNTIISFAIDKKRKAIAFMTFTHPDTYINYYDFDGKLVEKIRQNSTHPNRFYIFPQGEIAYFDYFTNGIDTINHEINIFDPSDHFLKGAFPYNQKTVQMKNKDIIVPEFIPIHEIANKESAFFFERPYDYNIYRVSSIGMDTAFHFIFPLMNSLPPDYQTDPTFNGKRLQYIKEKKYKIFGISHTYQINDNLFFSLETKGGLLGKDSYVYNLISGDLICLNKASPDSGSAFLPLSDDIFSLGQRFAYSDGIYLYSSVSSTALFQSKESTKAKSPNYPPAIQEYFKTQSRKANPVIVQLKPKDNI